MSRLIDYEPNTRTKPMRILCMGMARTGTNCRQTPKKEYGNMKASKWLTSTAMTIALRQLGFNPYHGSECFKNPPRDFNLWIEAMECNFPHTRKQKPYGREEFDRLMGLYDACMDIPACLFWEDLHRAYPDAKVILTTRDVDSWYKSADKTVFKFMQMPFFRVWHYFDTKCVGPLYRKSELVWRIFSGNRYDEDSCRRAYLEHYERIREVVPKDQLLDFRTGTDGWQELCRFLEVPVPNEPWPHVYPTAEFQEHIDVALKQAMGTIARWLGVGFVSVSGVVLWSYCRGYSLLDL